MEYHFYLGESEERQALLSNIIPYPHEEEVTHLYTNFRGEQVEVLRSFIALR